jgi:ATP synthase protein I
MQDHDARIVRGAIAATALAAPIAIGIAWLVAGPKGALGAGLGMALAAAFFSVTIVVVAWAGRVSPDLMLPSALATYTVKLIVLGLVMLWFRDTTAFDRGAFALAVVGGTVVYLAAELRIAARSRIPYISGPDDER